MKTVKVCVRYGIVNQEVTSYLASIDNAKEPQKFNLAQALRKIGDDPIIFRNAKVMPHHLILAAVRVNRAKNKLKPGEGLPKYEVVVKDGVEYVNGVKVDNEY